MKQPNAIEAATTRFLDALRAANGATVTHAALCLAVGAESRRMNEVVHYARTRLEMRRCARHIGPLFAVTGVGYRLEVTP